MEWWHGTGLRAQVNARSGPSPRVRAFVLRKVKSLAFCRLLQALLTPSPAASRPPLPHIRGAEEGALKALAPFLSIAEGGGEVAAKQPERGEQCLSRSGRRGGEQCLSRSGRRGGEDIARRGGRACGLPISSARP